MGRFGSLETEQLERNSVPAKAIPPERDRLQSRLLVWLAVPVLLYAAFRSLTAVFPYDGTLLGSAGRFTDTWPSSVAVSVFFALLVWRVRAATAAAAACGGLICLLLTLVTHNGISNILASGLSPLVLLFLFTFMATKWGSKHAAPADKAPPRNAAQVIANLGVAGLFASMIGISITAYCLGSLQEREAEYIGLMTLPMLAALAEATADTVSSEVGQAIGGRPFLITSWQRVTPGTDGAISLTGTAAGIAASAVVVASGIPATGTRPRDCLLALVCGTAGLFFDSVLGATVERKGWIGNDLVNFLSTAVAASMVLFGLRHRWF